MSRIHLNRNRQNLGQFSPEEVAVGLRSGRFLPTDLAWREGMETWQPLSTFTDLPAPADAVEPPPLDATAMPFEPVSPGPDVSSGPVMPSWERWEEAGMFRAAILTIREVITNPVATFRDLKRGDGMLRPFLFSFAMAIFCGLVGLLGELLWARFLPPGWVGKEGDLFAETIKQVPVALFTLFVAGAMAPFLGGGIYFLAAKLVAKEKVDFEMVFRVGCYVSGALSLVALIPIPPVQPFPIVIVVFSAVLNVAYMIIGFKEALKVPITTSAAIVALPLCVGCLCGFAGAALIVMAGQMSGSLPG